MFYATITQNGIITTGERRKTVANAFKAAEKTANPATRTRIELFEDGLPILVAFGDTLSQAIAEAMNMSRKARRGGGR